MLDGVNWDLGSIRDMAESDCSLVLWEGENEFCEGSKLNFVFEYSSILTESRVSLNLGFKGLHILVELVYVSLIEGSHETVEPLLLGAD